MSKTTLKLHVLISGKDDESVIGCEKYDIGQREKEHLNDHQFILKRQTKVDFSVK